MQSKEEQRQTSETTGLGTTSLVQKMVQGTPRITTKGQNTMTDTPEIGYYVERKNDLYKKADILETRLDRLITETEIYAQQLGTATLVQGQVLMAELLIEILKTLELIRAQE